MPRLVFSDNFRRHLGHPPEHGEGATLIEVLRSALSPTDLGYVIDERGALRRHINIFIDNEPILDRQTLRDAVGPEAEVCVMQALSGG